MPKMVSLQSKLVSLNGLIGTSDISPWEDRFLRSVIPPALAKSKLGSPAGLTELQEEKVDQIFRKHFAGDDE